MARKYAYLGSERITMEQFAQIQERIHAGGKLEAIKLMQTWTKLSLKDALYIADHFHTIDFRNPQPIPAESRAQGYSEDTYSSGYSSQEKAQHIVKSVFKGLATVLFFGGHMVFSIVSGLINPKKKRK